MTCASTRPGRPVPRSEQWPPRRRADRSAHRDLLPDQRAEPEVLRRTVRAGLLRHRRAPEDATLLARAEQGDQRNFARTARWRRSTRATVFGTPTRRSWPTTRKKIWPGQNRVSTLRDWRSYLPLLLQGALVTVEISCLAMAAGRCAGLARPGSPLRRGAGALGRGGLRRTHSRHAAAHPALPDLLRAAQPRHPAERLRGRGSRAGLELRGLRSGELPRRHPGHPARPDGSGAVAGHDAAAGPAAHHHSAGGARW